MKKDDLLTEIKEDGSYKKIVENLSNEEKDKLDKSVNVFLDEFCVPLIQQFNEALQSPEVMIELKKRLANGNSKVIKK